MRASMAVNRWVFGCLTGIGLCALPGYTKMSEGVVFWIEDIRIRRSSRVPIQLL